MKRIRLYLYLAVTIAIALNCLPAFAQKVTGDIAGTVTDATGAVVANATVTAESIDTKLTRSGTTSTAGAYRIPELPIGMYRLSVRVQGFKALERQAEVAAAKLTTADFQLQVGSTAEVVTVEATAPLIEFNDKLNNTMDQKLIERIPVSGLDFQALAALEPGVSRNPGGGFQTITVNGNRPDSNNYLVDGLYNNDRYYGDSAVGQTGIVGIPATLIPMDAIQEMTVQQAPSSEFGIKSGAP